MGFEPQSSPHEQEEEDKQPFLPQEDPLQTLLSRNYSGLAQLHIGDLLDVCNVFGNWCHAVIQQVVNESIFISYENMPREWDEWIATDSKRLAPYDTKITTDSLRTNQKVEVNQNGVTEQQQQQMMGFASCSSLRNLDSKQSVSMDLPSTPASFCSSWEEAIVVKDKLDCVLLRYEGLNTKHDHWVPKKPTFIAPSGLHTGRKYSRPMIDKKRLCSNENLVNELNATNNSSVKSRQHLRRVFQNIRCQQYAQALSRLHLQIVEVKGDGNCLFRSVSHQIYGRDDYHGLVRSYCMDYMESEKEYFEPYVVGDMSDYLRYIQMKRMDSVWGDDPEIQALCELYDRPAEVYAYDSHLGARKLRTFHENSGKSRNRPPIRLSFYGGGHYDSIVGEDTPQNYIRELAGEYERNRVARSRQIITREQTEKSLTLNEKTQSSVQLESKEIALALKASRNEFDAMNNNLEETLKASLAEYDEKEASQLEKAQLNSATEASELSTMQAEMLHTAQERSVEDQIDKAIKASLGSNATSNDGDDMESAIQASLAQSKVQYDKELEKALSLSGQERRNDLGYGEHDELMIMQEDEDEELQRAIQASLVN